MSHWYILVSFTITFTYNGYLNDTLLQHNYRGLLESCFTKKHDLRECDEASIRSVSVPFTNCIS